MTQPLKAFLFEQGYVRVKLKKIATNHFVTNAKINGVKGRFIIDTGASKSCVGNDDVDFFHLKTEFTEHKASGAGSTEIDTMLAKKNRFALGGFKLKN